MHDPDPLQNLDTGKSRLAECLGAGGRRALCEELLTHTLEQALCTTEAALIYVVTSDRNALVIAARYEIGGIVDLGGGLNAALDLARKHLLADDIYCDGVLTLPIDLPFVAGDVITSAMAVTADVVIGPDENRTGTNLLLLRGLALRRLPFVFGPGSYLAHIAAARSCGLTTATLEDRRIAFDIDDPSQYAAWISRGAWQGGIPDVIRHSSGQI